MRKNPFRSFAERIFCFYKKRGQCRFLFMHIFSYDVFELILRKLVHHILPCLKRRKQRVRTERLVRKNRIRAFADKKIAPAVAVVAHLDDFARIRCRLIFAFRFFFADFAERTQNIRHNLGTVQIIAHILAVVLRTEQFPRLNADRKRILKRIFKRSIVPAQRQNRLRQIFGNLGIVQIDALSANAALHNVAHKRTRASEFRIETVLINQAVKRRK